MSDRADGGVIAVYVVTFKRPEVLARNIETFWAGAHDPDRIRLTIINNHSEFRAPAGVDVRVLHNSTRPDRAWGNLARDWNAGLLDAFGTHRGSDVTWCLLAQNDVEWLPDWQRRLDDLPEHIEFFSQPRGDQSMGFRIEAVRDVGFFDERFSTIAFQEQDYFTRAAALLGDRASIDDDHLDGLVGRWNRRDPILNESSFHGYDVEDPTLHTTAFEPELANLLSNKWQIPAFRDIFDRQRMVARIVSGIVSLPEEIDWYPYFWEGRGAPGRSAAYVSTWTPPQRSYAIVEDRGERLAEVLARVVEHAGEMTFEVIVDCRDEQVVADLRQGLAANVAICPSLSHLTTSEREARLTHLARGSEVATLTRG